MTVVDPGSVSVLLYMRDGRVARSEVRCARPEVTRLLRGRVASQAVAMVPLIYSLCGRAQAVAARTALAAARGDAVGARNDPDVAAEAAREHAWALLVDWPRQFGLAGDEAFFVATVRGGGQDRAAEALRAHPVVAAMRDRLRPGGHAFDARLRERLEVRLAELLDWLEGRPSAFGTVTAAATARGAGRATVITARGPLIHELALDGDAVSAYRIIAPTDSHFAADGTLAAWLQELSDWPRDEAESLLRRAVMALDPCVPWTCEFR